jgi:jacalin-like lectin domain-containing protein/delta endotoxin-like protein
MSAELPDFNNLLREGILKLVESIEIEGIPVGGVLGSIIALLWTTDIEHEQKALWNGLKKYAEELVKEEIDKARIEALNNRLEGFGKVAEAYRNTSMSSVQKGQHLTNLLDALRLFHMDFWDVKNPEKMFPLFTAFGSLWIFALADQAFSYKQIYHADDPNADDHLKEFRANVTKYSNAAQAMYDRLYAWRFGLLGFKATTSKNPVLTGVDFHCVWTFTDKYDNYTKSESGGSQLNDDNFRNPTGQALMEREWRDRASVINGSWLKGLQETLAIAQAWRYVEPKSLQPLIHDVVDEEGPWGGDRDKARDFADNPPLRSRITKIRLRHGAFIDCLEVFYDGQSAGAHGNPSTGTLSELDLAADEHVVEVSGRSSSLIDHIRFKTNKGRTIEGGSSPHGNAFSTSGRRAWRGTSLSAVSGWTDGNRLCGLKLRWKHKSDLPTYSPSYKHSAKLTPWQPLYLKAADGRSISNAVLEYSGTAAAKEYWPKLGNNPVKLTFVPDPQTATEIYEGMQVWINTNETEVGEYKYLCKFTANDAYYYQAGNGPVEKWFVIKVIPSDGPVLAGDKIYLRNAKGWGYLTPAGEGYVAGAGTEMHAWEVVQPPA